MFILSLGLDAGESDTYEYRYWVKTAPWYGMGGREKNNYTLCYSIGPLKYHTEINRDGHGGVRTQVFQILVRQASFANDAVREMSRT